MGIIRGIKQSNSRIDKTLRMTGEGNSFLIGLDESSIASVARITADGGESTKQFIAKLNPGREMPQTACAWLPLVHL